MLKMHFVHMYMLILSLYDPILVKTANNRFHLYIFSKLYVVETFINEYVLQYLDTKHLLHSLSFK